MRFGVHQYDAVTDAIRDARGQLKPDGTSCHVCHDTGHQAWECGHNPLLAMALCEATEKRATEMHDRLHAIEEAMNDSDQSETLAAWRDDAHEFLHWLSGSCSYMGVQMGPARVALPEDVE